MNIHRNARTTPYSRAGIVRRVMIRHETPSAVATALGVSCRTVAKWLARYRCEGEAGLCDRSSRPRPNLEASNGGLMPFPGGLPIRRKGQMIGAIGVSGGAPSQDLEIAEAAVAALPR